MSATRDRLVANDRLVERLREALMPLADNPHVSEAEFAEVCDAHMAALRDLLMRAEFAEARLAAAEAMLAMYRREVEQ